MATLQESYNSGDDGYVSIDQGHWDGQTFTTGAAYSISSVKLLLYRHGSYSPGTVYVTIRAVGGGSLPTGSDLAAGTTDGSTLTTSTAGEWREITFDTPYALSIGTEYAIVVVCDNVANFALKWRGTSAGLYGSGQRVSSGDGSSWSGSSRDNMFETWGGSGATSHEVTGTASLAFSNTAAASVAFSVTGASTPAFSTPQADVSMKYSVTGAESLTFTTAGELTTALQVTGAATMQFSTSATLTNTFWDAIVTQKGTWAGSGNITTVGALASGSIATGFTEIAVDFTAAKCTDATADNTAVNETSHADVVVDGDVGTSVQAWDASLDSIAALTYAKCQLY